MAYYEIIKGKDFAPFAHRGKHAQLKSTLDVMDVGDCILVTTDEEKTACLAHGRSVGFRGFRIATRRDPETNGFFIWKLVNTHERD